MASAPLPANEAERLDALRGYNILDSLPEPAYDDIVQIASQICGTPIALVSLVDENRQWFKASVGIDATETPREVAFCAHAINNPNDVLVVEDASRDARFSANPLVTSAPNVRFYAGAPLVTSDGFALGTLCVIDHVARALSAEQRAALTALSRQVVAQLELHRSIEQLEARSAELKHSNQLLSRSRDQLAAVCDTLEGQADIIQRDLHRAEVIQRSLLPDEPPTMADFHVEALYRPGRSVGGDLYDVKQLGDHHLALFIADAAGHGVSAAMLSVLFKHRLRYTDPQTKLPYTPAAAMAQINAALLADIAAPGVFVTAAYCLLDTTTGELAVASAGQTPITLLRRDGSIEELEHTGPALGLYHAAAFDEHRVQLSAGDRVLMSTDGLSDVGGDEPATPTMLGASLRQFNGAEDALKQAFIDIAHGREREERDDVTLLLLEASPGESHFFEMADTDAISPIGESDQPGRITHAEAEAGTIIALGGRVTWMLGDALLQAATAVIDAKRPLIIDLCECDYLDSTLLGTLHEIVMRGDAAGQPVAVQRASGALKASFEELSLADVLAHEPPAPTEVPEHRRPIDVLESSARRHQERLLRAHEVLVTLSEENREEFGHVVETMHKELD